MYLLAEPSRYLSRYRQEASRFFYEIDLHHTAADAAEQLTICTDGHLVTLTPRTGTRAFGNDKQHYILTSPETLVDELPELEFVVHVGILSYDGSGRNRIRFPVVGCQFS